ncbi:hemicentin-1-like [Dendronephthya gigantea]|uniref:hemicentin-1-like n=1 Tax=Dendronephthya gigantea TaxID=151771 RepID=UPI00106BAAA2|nr:hemicentin-1-like [Dendronephthya gigantea]
MDSALQVLCMVLILASCCGGNRHTRKQRYLFVSYGHSVQINCSLRKSEVNVTLFVKRFSTPYTKVAIDNVKWRQSGGLFTMSATRPLDGGEYMCKAINGTGHERITKEITIIPIVAPTNDKFKVEVKPPSLSLQYEDFANISCSALGKRKLRWYKLGPGNQVTPVGGDQLINDDHYDTDGGSRIYHSRLILSIKDATNKNAGKYKCVARSNNQRLEEFVVVSVRAPKKPSIRNFPQTVIASEGISITLKCKTKGSPRPKITWYKDDELLGICEGGNSRKCRSFTRMNTEFKKNSITLHQLSSRRNSGKYTCEVENFMGKFSSSARMIVFSKPVLAKRSDTNFYKVVPIQYTRSPPAVLRCPLTGGHPQPKITWEFQSSNCLKNTFACRPSGDWKRFDNGGERENEFIVAPPFGPGFYRCLATNILGNDYQIFAVRKLSNGSSRRRFR